MRRAKKIARFLLLLGLGGPTRAAYLFTDKNWAIGVISPMRRKPMAS